MPEIDFYTFGIVSNDPLLERINGALTEIYAFGNFTFRSAWLYYGTKRAAAQALGIPLPIYRNMLTRPNPHSKRCELTNWNGIALDLMPDKLRSLLLDGASMILEMSNSERRALFPVSRQPPTVKEAFVKKVESWRTEPIENEVALCVSLLEKYKRMWRCRHNPRTLFESPAGDSLKRILGPPISIENKAGESEICSVALEIIREYETYRWHREQVNAHKKSQRKILNGRRRFFLEALILRDGKRCAHCKSNHRRLEIDHRHPLSLGGLTEIDNLQLLCFRCNSKKSNKPPQRGDHHAPPCDGIVTRIQIEASAIRKAPYRTIKNT